MTRALLVASIAITASRVDAQPAGAQAEVLFKRGKALMSEGKTAEACAAFESSQKLDPQITTLLNLGDCREKNGQLASAWGLFVEAERQTRGGSGGARKLNEVAKTRAAKLEPRVPKLSINVTGAVPGLTVTRNGQTVDAGAFGTALPIDGGTFEIVARAPGFEPWSTTVTVAAENDQKVVDVPELKKPGAAPTEGTTQSTPKTATQLVAPSPGAAPERRSRLVPISLLVGGGVFAASAVGLEIWARSKYDSAVVEPNDAKQESLWRAANLRRGAAIGTGIAAAGCVGVAVYLFVRSPSNANERATATRVHVQPVAGADLAGVLVSGSF